MGRLSIKGIVVGGIVDIIGSNLVAIPVILYAMTQLPGYGPRDAEAISRVIQGSVVLYGVLFILGAVCSVGAGYIAASLAKHDDVLNGALSAFLCVGSELWSLTSGHTNGIPAWLVLVSLPGSPLLGALGGYLRARAVRSHRREAPVSSGAAR